MSFSDKLNLLMIITNTTNSSLARNVSLDASYVSRLRRGIRTPAKNENYLRTIATYFSRNCTADYQKDALCKAINIPSKNLIENNDNFTEYIHKWFLEIEEDYKESIENFLQDITQFSFKKATKSIAINDSIISNGVVPHAEVFYGIKGKQNAVISFLYRVSKNKDPQTLLLYSNEDLEWLTMDLEFTAKWSSLLSQIIMNGNKIKIIHTVNRNLDEMLSAIKEWLPLYMTGCIEPYYYPKARDGVFRRTLFIAPDTVTVASTSIRNNTANSANFLYTDKNTIKALTEEYNNYLSLCRPLMRIFTSTNKENYLGTLSEFEAEDGYSIIKASELSIITMPMSALESILSCTDINTQKQLLSYHKKRISKFENNLEKHKFTEIITLPDVEKVKRGDTKVGFSDILNETQLLYTPKQFIAHLQNIIRLIKTFDHYNIYIQSDSKSDGNMLYIKEDVGIIVAKTSLPSVIFAINESNMVAAFWNYMNDMLNKTAKDKVQKKHTVAKLEEFIEKLKM